VAVATRPWPLWCSGNIVLPAPGGEGTKDDRTATAAGRHPGAQATRRMPVHRCRRIGAVPAVPVAADAANDGKRPGHQQPRGRRAATGASRHSVAAAVACAAAQHLSVHEPVDDLCKKAVGLCAGGEILGIAVALPCPCWASTWVNTIHILCINETPELSTCHAAMPGKYSQSISKVYLAVM